MSKTIFKYSLWGLTLATVWWVAAITSALVGSKGPAATAVPGLDSGAGEVLADA